MFADRLSVEPHARLGGYRVEVQKQAVAGRCRNGIDSAPQPRNPIERPVNLLLESPWHGYGVPSRPLITRQFPFAVEGLDRDAFSARAWRNENHRQGSGKQVRAS